MVIKCTFSKATQQCHPIFSLKNMHEISCISISVRFTMSSLLAGRFLIAISFNAKQFELVWNHIKYRQFLSSDSGPPFWLSPISLYTFTERPSISSENDRFYLLCDPSGPVASMSVWIHNKRLITNHPSIRSIIVASIGLPHKRLEIQGILAWGLSVLILLCGKDWYKPFNSSLGSIMTWMAFIHPWPCSSFGFHSNSKIVFIVFFHMQRIGSHLYATALWRTWRVFNEILVIKHSVGSTPVSLSG